MSKQTIGIYIIIGLTIIGAVINAVTPFVSPAVASVLVVIASLITGYLHPQAVNSAVGTAMAEK